MVPNGWKEEELGNMARFISGGTPNRATTKYWNGDIPWLSAKDMKTFWLSDSQEKVTEAGAKNGTTSVPAGSILVLVRGMTLMKNVPVGVTTRLVTFNQDVKALLPIESVRADFLGYAIVASKRVLMSYVDQAGHGTGRMPTELLREHVIFVPPLPEQRAIATILATWDRAIEQTTRLIEAKRRLKQGLMQQMLTGKLRFPVFNCNWEHKKIGDLVRESRDLASSPDMNTRITVKLNLKGIEKREIRIREDGTTYYIRRAGQFIYGKQNLHKGAMGLVPDELDGYESSQDIPAFDFLGECIPEWFLYFMSRESFYTNLETIAKGTGSKRIHPSDLNKIPVHVPSISEQREIAECLGNLDHEIKLHKELLDNFKTQKQALMQKLLTGQVRVKVEEEDKANAL
ncbi:MAG: restriction endonuclease subunit S [bacterium]